ncbi:PKD domain-containing protein [Arthrobacter sp. NEB 688]|uniref:PKD domain-containing protein n=1 Tax=Arthrobacter sp. NEB 688 TaxID=904039 RepID=UPI0015672FC3|nr:PKD domain-containing protein [Arthrobacter sp. NEB 688]QKE85805.1 PKD domain-containing protein [Arthrobacter sp. NEB 688]
MPTEIPSATTPGITVGSKAMSFAEVGDKVFAAGTFTEVGGQARAGIAAFDRTTGALDPTFNPTILGQVYAVTPGPTANTIYVAGILRNVNGVALNKVALLDATTGAPVAGFKPPTIDQAVQDIKYRAGNLYLAGDFTAIGGQQRLGLASLNPTTGALTDALRVDVTEHHNTDPTQVQKAVGAKSIDITKDGSRLVAIGNFRKANGLDRDQVVQVNLTGTSSSIDAWQTNGYKGLCYNFANDWTVRTVSLSPDGSYFVIGSGGGGGPALGTLCDTAVKWKTQNPVVDAKPEWVAAAGGDTIWAVAVTDYAVFVGGHQRWMNNYLGNDYAAPGAVPRSGISAVDPLSGVPMKWNPGRVPRGTAVFGLLAAKDGIWLGSDTDYIGINPAYKRQKLAFFPFQGGYTATATTTPTLPATVYDGRGGLGSATNVLYRVNAGGPAIGSGDTGPDWSADDGFDSPYRNSGSNGAGWSPAATYDSTVPSSVPSALFDSERWDPNGDPELKWAFPVTAGVPVSVNVYFANRCGCTSAAGQRVFDVSIDGNLAIDDLDLAGQVGNNVATKRSFNITSDGLVNIDFTHVVENPLVNAIEIVRTDTTPGPVQTDALASWRFDGTTAGPESLTASGIDWSTVRGAFTVGDKLFYGTGSTLMTASFDGRTIGTPSAVNPYHDPKWMNWPNGSGGTYDGATPNFYGELSSVRGMFYADGNVYYANGGTALRSVPFSPDSGIVGPVSTTVSSPMSFADAGGMFVAGGKLYFVKRSTGDLWSIGWANGTTTGSETRVDGPSTGGRNWNGRALFLGNPLANKLPTASFTATCAGLTCSFDGSASADPDGIVTGWSWSFGDGTTATGSTTQRTYATAGSKTVTLTVTDNAGDTATVTQTVDPVDVPAGTGYIARSATTDAAATTKSLQVPAEAKTGDTLLLHWVGDPASAPTTDPAGWTRVKAVNVGTSLSAIVWSRQAGASDAGATVTLTQPVSRRTTVQMVVYRGYGGVRTSDSTTDSSTATHLVPSQTVTAGEYVVAFFADRSSATDSWTAGAGQIARGSVLGTSTTRYSTFVSDSGAPASAGTVPGASAVVNAPSAKGIGISVVLLPPGQAPPNQAPVASFTSSCTGLTCQLDASASSDPDGSVVSYAWDLGDGSSATGATTQRTYAAGGTKSVTLTVTDDKGSSTQVTKPVEPVAAPAGTGFVARSATTDAAATVKTLTVPAQAQAGDTLLVHWVGDPASKPADPAGWTQVRAVDIGTSLSAVAWTKQATSGDAGTTVSLTQPVSRRTTAQLFVYRGYAGVAASASTTDSGTATHATPSQAVLSGDYVVALFADRSTGTDTWTPASGQTARGSVVGTSTTRYSTFVSDAGAPSSAGTDPGTSAVVNAASLKGIGMSIVLRP